MVMPSRLSLSDVMGEGHHAAIAAKTAIGRWTNGNRSRSWSNSEVADAPTIDTLGGQALYQRQKKRH
jgi:hypothetical protein